ncbi:hypothetical protein [Pontibacter cellulosilyticus]|uniref:Uncharacterized protein n=1 Tax=Pontibacter cellulosilyticus TaxID=1720253 RepID=A0A923SKQ5_9BACT|nr:hypothetical protein [Pontibacter cellulosilyticus]MBC5994016.1 hypothetical protein [Pontibacter cellulosilyticus]
MKTILAISHASGKGKTQTIRELANLLLGSYPTFVAIKPIPAKVPVDGDFQLIIEIAGIVIGIESMGDPGTGLEKRLQKLAGSYSCDIIICATRTRGETVAAVENAASTWDYDTIWTSTYQVIKKHQAQANQLKAKHLLDLLQQLLLLPIPTALVAPLAPASVSAI